MDDPICEFDTELQVSGVWEARRCTQPATVYGGYAGAGEWAGRACDEHASSPGFRTWEQLSGNPGR